MAQIHWLSGTAYDFFISIFVLHHAERFGLRPSWAAGVRQRLSAPKREFLEKIQPFSPVPLEWMTALPAPADTVTALEILSRLDSAARWAALTLAPDTPPAVAATLEQISARKSWTADEKEFLRTNYYRRGDLLKLPVLESLLESWSHAAASGELLLEALQEYYSAFFAEEESRIRPILESVQAESQALADEIPLEELVTRLSRGVHLDGLDSLSSLTLIPSYWCAPLIFISRPSAESAILAYGARPEDVSLVPGSGVPSGLVNALKALADPSRLRILRDLSVQPLTPTELARRLRLRAPTVVHHLRILRLAGLVEITISTGNERLYAARLHAIEEHQSALREFLQ
jgi:DNA-binding transcriptional ArsR family regulator